MEHTPSTSDPVRILILGASGGIGAAVARATRNRGWIPILAGRNRERLLALSEDLGASWKPLEGLGKEPMENLFDEVAQEQGGLEGVVNAIGSLFLRPAHLTAQADFEETLRINLGSAFACVAAAGSALRRKGGSVVLFSSAAARVGLANHEAIAAAKSGIVGLARSAAATYARAGIRFNVVSPGLVETPLTQTITSKEGSRKASEKLHALGRLGQPEEIASAAVWLLDPAQSWVTGQDIGVDGGLGSIIASHH
jgi:NAD(P)-dependent dehydrogenase (short-subunit alcohol dehydrogenase family)